MAGKFCYGEIRNNCGAGTLQDSKAFAEGILYRASGTGAARPNTGCPHVLGSGAYVAWQLGWGFANSAPGGSLGAVGCAAPTGVIPV